MRTMTSMTSVCGLALFVAAVLYPQATSKIQTVPVVANIESTQTTQLKDGNQIVRKVEAKFYRDGSGRTRLDQGSQATISDPTEYVVYMLDLNAKSCQRIDIPKGQLRSTQPDHTQPAQPTQPRAQLGFREIDGIPTTGAEYVNIIPAGSSLGNSKAIEKITRVWHSEELQLPVLITIADPMVGDLTVQYKYLQRGGSVSAEIFRVPAGFKIVAGPAPVPPPSGTFPRQ